MLSPLALTSATRLGSIQQVMAMIALVVICWREQKRRALEVEAVSEDPERQEKQILAENNWGVSQ